MQLTEAQVLGLAPDAASQKAGQGLSGPKKWVTLGANTQALWGECQGSGSKPYQTRVDFSDLNTKCSCPSRKFPCKHAIGLMLMYAATPAVLKDTVPPGWVTEWLEGRQAKQSARKEKEDKPVDAAQQAKRQQARENKVEGGIQELKVWLSDLLHAGLAQVNPQTLRDRENMERRLIDAQAPGLARMVRGLNFSAHGQDFPGSLMRQLGDLFLLLQAFDRLDTLPELLQQDVKTAIGFTQDQKALLLQDGIKDDWLVIGQKTESDERLWTRQTYFYGLSSQKYAMVLDYAHGQPSFNGIYAVGSVLYAELVYFVSGFPLRALVKTSSVMLTEAEPEAHPNLQSMLDGYAAAVAQNPWMVAFPALISGITVSKPDRGPLFQDSQGQVLPTSVYDQDFWTLLALSGGKPIQLFGQYNGGVFVPFSAFVEGQAIALKGGHQ
ncbi:SWIM zinc finger family protein [Deinococcus roseus]|uniref:SWIM-type domain-containing protein n=1 Tax=Deinococcus roseus TaxID=392414 RepID=A0ABQ2DGM1_9DEIO|nr:SWIM zinc finger family protein [Deinococcus roseus]GGJ55028.1 hypothetical protein GCM10008938_46370 [Deinococcus roseus]